MITLVPANMMFLAGTNVLDYNLFLYQRDGG